MAYQNNADLWLEMNELWRDRQTRRRKMLLAITAFFSLCIMLLLFFYVKFDKNEFELKTEDLKNGLIVAINNGAQLDDIDLIFKDIVSSESRKIYIRAVGSGSIRELTLQSVLEMTLADMYLKENQKDIVTIEKIKSLMRENEQLNPFERLDNTQRGFFENVRMKAGGNYEVIRSDIDKISDELHSKNVLVDKYLADAETSLYVSIISILSAVSFSLFQIFGSKDRKVIRMMQKLLESSELVEDDRNMPMATKKYRLVNGNNQGEANRLDPDTSG